MSSVLCVCIPGDDTALLSRGECLVSCLIITMTPLTTATLALCLLVCLACAWPWESSLVLATCCLVLCWDRGRLDSLGNMETSTPAGDHNTMQRGRYPH